MKNMLFITWVTALLFSATAGEMPIPRVELDFGSMGARDWNGKKFREIIPADTIQRIVRTSESGFARGRGVSAEQADYDEFFAHLLSSAEKAKDWALGGNEATLAELVILTKTGDLFRIEIVGHLGFPKVPTVVLIYGRGRGARIEVTDFKFPKQADLGAPNTSALVWGEGAGSFQMACSVDASNGVLHCWVHNAVTNAVAYNDFDFGYCENISLEIRQGAEWTGVGAQVFPGENTARGAVPTDAAVRWLQPGQIITETWARRDALHRRTFRKIPREALLARISEGDTFMLDLVNIWWPANILHERSLEARVRHTFHSASPDDRYPYMHGPELTLYSPVLSLDAAVIQSFVDRRDHEK